jgi:RimJ/RimL family protein N-acetyltransferase
MAAVVGHWSLRGYGTWAVEDRATGAYVGWCGLWFPEGWPEPELGYALVRAAQGRGLATEAALAARAFAYETLGWSTLISFIDLRNQSSQRVAERLGARCESTRLLRGMEGGIYRHPAPAAAALT